MKITVEHNGFHGLTKMYLSFPHAKPGETVPVSLSQFEKLVKEPCGISDCSCGEGSGHILDNWENLSFRISQCLNREEQRSLFASGIAKLTLSGNGTIKTRGNYPQN